MDKKEWIQNRANEIALKQTGHKLCDLGPHLQLISYMRAMADYIDGLPK